MKIKARLTFFTFSIIALLVMTFTSSCKKELNFSKGNLTFSTDTLVFDTVFTTIGSTTKRFRFRNPSKQTIKIDEVELMGGPDSPFRMNVDGFKGTLITDLEIEGEDSFEFHYEVTLPEMEEAAKIWIPVPQSDDFQTVELITLETTLKHQRLKEKKYGNSILYMELSPEDSGKKVKLSYDVERQEKKPYEENSWPAAYLDASLLMPVGDRFKILADSIIGDKRNGGTIMQTRALYDYIIDNMRYIKAGTYGTGDAVYACDALTGNCTEFHSLFISLARSAGIPSRFGVGASIPSDRDEGGIDGYHCWAEFYT